MKTFTKPFLDTEILVYAIAQDDPRADVAEQLLSEGGVIGIQTLNEFVSVARRRLKMEWDEITRALEEFQTLCPNPVAVSMETHRQAISISRQYGLNIHDSLTVAAALLAGCTRLLSEVLHHGLTVNGKLTVTNPFAG